MCACDVSVYVRVNGCMPICTHACLCKSVRIQAVLKVREDSTTVVPGAQDAHSTASTAHRTQGTAKGTAKGTARDPGNVGVHPSCKHTIVTLLVAIVIIIISSLFVRLLLNVPATCKCISGTDLHRELYVLPH